MSYMFEIYYQAPADDQKEAALTEQLTRLGGRLDYHEEPDGNRPGSICLTFEFDSLEQAEQAAALARQQGEYVEGPMAYGA